MRIFILLILTVFNPGVTAETEYRSADEDGNTIYSDKPTPGAEEIHVEDAQAIDQPDAGPFTYTPPKQAPASQYTALTITSPENDASVRDNTGNIIVSVTLEPGLSPGRGDQLALYMDGAQVSVGTSAQFELSNVDRGTHSLTASVISKSGKDLISSSPVSFTILRHAVSPPPPPPPKKPPSPPPPPP